MPEQARHIVRKAFAAAPGIFLTGDPAKESIFLSKRKGFVRMAIQEGAGATHSSCRAKPCWQASPASHPLHGWTVHAMSHVQGDH